MAYIDGLLGQGERILIVERRHPIFIAGRLALFILAAAVLVALGVWLGTAVSRPAGIIVGALAVIPLVWAVWRFLAWHREQYVVTNARIVQVEGIITKRVMDSSLEKVNDILLTQSAMGRLFNYGTLEIVTGSEIGVNRLDALAEPFRFKRAILDARSQMGWADDRRPAPPEDVTRLLVALNDLRNAGVLSESEYLEKRADLLGSEAR